MYHTMDDVSLSTKTLPAPERDAYEPMHQVLVPHPIYAGPEFDVHGDIISQMHQRLELPSRVSRKSHFGRDDAMLVHALAVKASSDAMIHMISSTY